MTSCMRPSRISSPTETRTSVFCQRANTDSVASRYDALPPSTFDDSFVRFAIAPLMPALAMLAK